MKRLFLKVLLFGISLLFVMTVFNDQGLFSQELELRIIKSGAVLRLQPAGSQIIMDLPLGTVLQYEEQIEEWFKIRMYSKESGRTVIGYVHSSFVEILKQPAPTIIEKRPEISLEKKVDTAQINQRQKPSISKNDIPIELAKAKANRSLGTTLAISGAAVFIPCIILTFTHQVFDWTTLSYKARTPYIVGDAIGLGLAITGLAVLISANTAINQINYEMNTSSSWDFNLIVDKKTIGIQFSASF